TSSTPWGWEGMCRLPPATGMMPCLPFCSIPGNSLSCACPIRWDSTQKGWTAGSMIRKAAGKERDCGPPTVPERLFTPKAAKERPARSCTSSCAPTRSHTKRKSLEQAAGRMGAFIRGDRTREFAVVSVQFLGRALEKLYRHYRKLPCPVTPYESSHP